MDTIAVQNKKGKNKGGNRSFRESKIDFWEMQELEQIYETLDKLKEEGDNKAWHVTAEHLKTHWPKESRNFWAAHPPKKRGGVPDPDSATTAAIRGHLTAVRRH